MTATTNFPQVRACIFDMDGLLINSEDKVTQSINMVLAKHGHVPLTTAIRAQLMGVHNSSASDVFHDWAKLAVDRNEFALECAAQMRLLFPDCEMLPGAEALLANLGRARTAISSGEDEPIAIAMASSTPTASFEIKSSRPEMKLLLDSFPTARRVLGDDPRLTSGRRKPAPDLYILALQLINKAAEEAFVAAAADTDGKHEYRPILPNECLAFEDSIVGVEAGRRAGMRVIWVPHPEMAPEYEPIRREVLAGRTGRVQLGDEWQLGELDDGWAEAIPSLEHFDYEKYGIRLT